MYYTDLTSLLLFCLEKDTSVCWNNGKIPTTFMPFDNYVFLDGNTISGYNCEIKDATYVTQLSFLDICKKVAPKIYKFKDYHIGIFKEVDATERTGVCYYAYPVEFGFTTCSGYGATVEEALENCAECFEEVTRFYITSGKNVPLPNVDMETYRIFFNKPKYIK